MLWLVYWKMAYWDNGKMSSSNWKQNVFLWLSSLSYSFFFLILNIPCPQIPLQQLIADAAIVSKSKKHVPRNIVLIFPLFHGQEKWRVSILLLNLHTLLLHFAFIDKEAPPPPIPDHPQVAVFVSYVHPPKVPVRVSVLGEMVSASEGKGGSEKN